MSKKILMLTGGARHGGNSEKMADAFMKGAKAAGHEVVRYDAGFKNIKGCIFCETCYKLGDNKACSHDEVFNELAPYYEWADSLVIVTPLYWYTYTAQIKAALDKVLRADGGKTSSADPGSISDYLRSGKRGL